jgi:hypothetical protein
MRPHGRDHLEEGADEDCQSVRPSPLVGDSLTKLAVTYKAIHLTVKKEFGNLLLIFV